MVGLLPFSASLAQSLLQRRVYKEQLNCLQAVWELNKSLLTRFLIEFLRYLRINLEKKLLTFDKI